MTCSYLKFIILWSVTLDTGETLFVIGQAFLDDTLGLKDGSSATWASLIPDLGLDLRRVRVQMRACRPDKTI